MKKLLLSFLMCMLAVVGMQAETKTYTYDFSKNTNFVTAKGGSTNVGTGSSNKLKDFYYKQTDDKFNSNGAGYFNSGYFLWGKSGAYIELPTYDGEKITNVTATSSSGGSTNVTVAIYSGTTSVVSATKWASKSTDYSYIIPEAYQSSVLRLQITNAYNAQITKLVITTETTGEEVITVEEPVFTPETGATFEESLDVAISVKDGLTAYYSTDDKATYTAGSSLTITETTTVYAYAQDANGNKSDVVSATYTKVELVDGVWSLVTDASILKADDQIVIASKESLVAISTTQNNNNRGQAAITKDGNTITFGEDVQIITLEAGSVDNTWAFNVGTGYLYAASSGSNYLKTQKNKDGNASWTITINGGVASIIAQGSNTRNVMQYNQSSGLFACYASASQSAVAIYRLEGGMEEETITAGAYYLNPGIWENNDCALYAIEFVNKNTAKTAWVQGFLSNHFVTFELVEGAYTHMTFHRIKNSTANTAQQITDWTAIETLNKTAELTYTPVAENMIQYYNITATELNTQVSTGEWVAVVGTGLDRVESINGIGYAYGVVSAEGAIEVYNLNGVVVARGNDNIDLRGLNRGVYIVRNGNQVRKVVR